MSRRDPLTFPRQGTRKFDNLREAFEEFAKQAPIGITQGGSSHRDKGAKSAAKDGNIQSNTPATTRADIQEQ